MTKVWFWFAYSSLLVRLSERLFSKFWAKIGVSRLSDANDESLDFTRSGFARGSLKRAAKFRLGVAKSRSLERVLIWAEFQLTISNPISSKNPIFDSPITQNDFRLKLWVQYLFQAPKQLIGTQLTT